VQESEALLHLSNARLDRRLSFLRFCKQTETHLQFIYNFLW